MRIGFIGLGNMGAPMATNLSKAGHRVQGYDPVAPCPAEVTRTGSATKAVEGAEIVFTMLPDSAALRQVAEEILPVMKSPTIFCDCSTVDVQSARDVARDARNFGI